MHWYVVFREIGVHDTPEPVVGHRLLVQRHADAHDHAAENLAAPRLCIDDSAGGDRAHDAVHTDDAYLFIDLHLDKYRSMRASRVVVLRAGRVRLLPLDPVHAAAAHGLHDRHSATWITLVGDRAVDQDHVIWARA